MEQSWGCADADVHFRRNLNYSYRFMWIHTGGSKIILTYWWEFTFRSWAQHSVTHQYASVSTSSKRNEWFGDFALECFVVVFPFIGISKKIAERNPISTMINSQKSKQKTLPNLSFNISSNESGLNCNCYIQLIS